ncbi:hypothetical protein [Silvanigrella aquatica]|uniref:Uncharacterized protein n=1 Tax=Silvanigrella aquatica TaxID=1915309 RepID=A0A1L4D4X3_9BACT|nr:hypothetical protein [Silvanigrella aquatica]APJ05265.1 hypothetical protein AXG55_14685 [Silvanigrella aquatica]
MIHLKFKEDEEDTELISFIKDGVGDFDLPKFINLPRGERAMTSRARMLMIAGLEALKKEFPKKRESVIQNEINTIKLEKNNIDKEIPKSWT